ncbi:MAG: L,D-transpeptidase family protein [Flavobacteriales bacterium]|nr:L,D-transpeptidase family protein [Flavobacteriales bacterium]
MDEQARDINEVFETEQVYSVRLLDTAVVSSFLRSDPGLLSDPGPLIEFYERREWQPAWFVQDSLSTAALNMLNLMGRSMGPDTPNTGNDTLLGFVERILDQRDTVPMSNEQMDRLELLLTTQFFRYAEKEYSGQVQRELHELDWFIPRRKKDLSQLIDSLAAGTMDLSPIEPLNEHYKRLKGQLTRYYALRWLDSLPPLELGQRKKLVPGERDTLVPLIRERLQALGDMPFDPFHAPDELDSVLVTGLQRFQERHGLTPDGIIGKGVLEQLNTPISERIRTILLNMERLRWMPVEQAPELILVNIPEFRSHVFSGDSLSWSMDVVVGSQATSTVIFSDSVSQIVFSPSWSVPASIVRNELLPAMRKDPDYLAKKGMDIVGGSEALPRVRQRPGPNNALGRVKFLFPNSYSIYLHDTPSKGTFAREDRAASHGCIRLSRPELLAQHLLRGDTAWSAEAIKQAMDSRKETIVDLDRKVPVLIGYFTAWVDEQGRLNFRKDVYGHDQRLAKELFGAPERTIELVRSDAQSPTRSTMR